MKRFVKGTIGFAALLLVAGIALSVSGKAMGGETTMEVDAFGRRFSVGTGPLGLGVGFVSGARSGGDARTEGAQNLAAFRDIDVDLCLGDVIVRQGDDYGVSLEWSGKSYELYWTNENDILTVWSANSAPSIINLGGYSATVTITVPVGAYFDNVSIQADLGRVELSGFNAETLDVTADLGDVDVRSLQTEDAVFALDLGSITLDGFSAGTLDVWASLGNVTGKKMDVADFLTVTADLGSVDLRGTLRTHTEITADMGSIRLDSGLPASACSYDLDTDMGSVNVDGREQGDSASGGRGDNYFSCTASMGSVELNFMD